MGVECTGAAEPLVVALEGVEDPLVIGSAGLGRQSGQPRQQASNHKDGIVANEGSAGSGLTRSAEAVISLNGYIAFCTCYNASPTVVRLTTVLESFAKILAHFQLHKIKRRNTCQGRGADVIDASSNRSGPSSPLRRPLFWSGQGPSLSPSASSVAIRARVLMLAWLRMPFRVCRWLTPAESKLEEKPPRTRRRGHVMRLSVCSMTVLLSLNT